jgi:hypothetical protein
VPDTRIWGGSNLAAGSDSELGGSLHWTRLREIAEPIVQAAVFANTCKRMTVGDANVTRQAIRETLQLQWHHHRKYSLGHKALRTWHNRDRFQCPWCSSCCLYLVSRCC